MRRILIVSILLIAGQHSGIAGDKLQRLKKPSYPLFGIVQVHPTLRGKPIPSLDNEVFTPLVHYRGLYTGDGPFLRRVLKAAKEICPEVKVICYMGGFTTNVKQFTLVETKYRDGIAMIDVSRLARPVDEARREIEVEIPRDGEFPILVSKANESVERDTSQFCFWIQVDSELMQVLAVDEASGRLRVERGFRLYAASHLGGAPVLAPVYLGNRDKPESQKARSSNSYPYAEDYLRYGLNPGSEGAQRFKADLICELMKKGYDGAWLDTFSIRPFNLCDALGRKVTYFWDFETGQRYTPERYGEALLEMVDGIRRRVRDAMGRVPYLAANACTWSYDQGAKTLFRSGENPRGLDAYCFEDAFIKPVAKRVAGRRVECRFELLKKAEWLRNVKNLRDAARSGLHGIAMTTAAGYLAGFFSPDQPNYESLDRFAWCSYLLTVTPERATSFGKPVTLWQKEGALELVPLSEQYFLPIGEPVEDMPIEKYELGRTGCYTRRFQNAVVIVNPSAEERKIDLDGRLGDLVETIGTKHIALGSGDGQIIMLGQESHER